MVNYYNIRIYYLQAPLADRQKPTYVPESVSAEQVVDPVKIHQVLTDHFNESELKNLCFCLGIDHEELSENNKTDKARELIEYMKRHGRDSELVGLVKQLRPNVSSLSDQQVTPQAQECKNKTANLQ